MLLFAGHETTRNLIGNAIHTLLLNPDQLELLRRQPELVTAAIEETLRYQSPVQLVVRAVSERIDVAGQQLEPGAMMCFMIGAAQRDPRQYPDPDTFNIRRTHLRHLAFGGDAHVCLGATLARLETRLALAGLLNRFDTIELVDGSVAWMPSFVLRGMQSLRVRLSAARKNSTANP